MRLLGALAADRRLLAAVAGSLAVVAGSFLQWAHAEIVLGGSLSETGIHASGKLTFVLGVVALAMSLAYATLRAADLAIGAAAAALAAGGLAVAYRIGVADAGARIALRRGFPGTLSVRAGAGVWVVIGGALVVAAAMGLSLAARRRAASP